MSVKVPGIMSMTYSVMRFSNCLIVPNVSLFEELLRAVFSNGNELSSWAKICTLILAELDMKLESALDSRNIKKTTSLRT